jgi:hypothetical protein
MRERQWQFARNAVIAALTGDAGLASSRRR